MRSEVQADAEPQAAPAPFVECDPCPQRLRLTTESRRELQHALASLKSRPTHEVEKMAKALSSLSEFDSGFFTAPTNLMEEQFKNLAAAWQEHQQLPEYQAMFAARQRLPAFRMRDEILAACSSNQVVVIGGDTGCGKTTQVPQFLLDDALSRCENHNLVCTQPRRISAVSVAERVAAERAEVLGKTVGYQIRLERVDSESTRLLYCTTGVMLRRMLVDPQLERVTHVVVDEIHERSLESDFLLIILRDLLRQRPDLRVVLMSATMNAKQFSDYFGGCPVLHIPGSTHPVETHFIEDVVEMLNFDFRGGGNTDSLGRPRWGSLSPRFTASKVLSPAQRLPQLRQELGSKYSPATVQSLAHHNEDELPTDLIESLVCHIAGTQPQGAILVFLPGWVEIQDVHKLLLASPKLAAAVGGAENVRVLPLHSNLAASEQRLVFEPLPPNMRKIVLSTNIAETSVTIEDVVYVIDTGKHKAKEYNPSTDLSSLLPAFVTQASARQRRGRAGRVRPGVCFHLYRKAMWEQLPPYSEPEIKRIPLDSLCLQIRALGLAPEGKGGIQTWLARALEPPIPQSVVNGLRSLHEQGAVDDNEALTHLGWHMSSLPMTPRTSKSLIMACLLGCLDPVLTITCITQFTSPFSLSTTEQSNAITVWSKLLPRLDSDHFAQLSAYNAWHEANEQGEGAQFADKHFLSHPVLTMVKSLREQMRSTLADAGFLGAEGTERDTWALNRNSHLWPVVRAALVAGMFPNAARITVGGRRIRMHDRGGAMAPFFGSMLTRGSKLPHRWACFFAKARTPTGVAMFDVSACSPLPLLLLGATGPGATPLRDVMPQLASTEIPRPFLGPANWVYFDVEEQDKPLLSDVREALWGYILRSLWHPTRQVLPEETQLVESVCRAIVADEEASVVEELQEASYVPVAPHKRQQKRHHDNDGDEHSQSHKQKGSRPHSNKHR